MSKKLFVGNLAFTVTQESLSDLFSQFGMVDSCRIITDRDTGRSKGFGFVEMSSSEEAENATSALANREFEGRALNVNEAKPFVPRNESAQDDRYSPANKRSAGNGYGRDVRW